MSSHLIPPPPHDNEPRFKSITSPCEYVEDYHSGVYHPVHLGDIFNNGQYRVIRKLGEGSYSTLWLAHDLQNHTYVALKILKFIISETPPELQMLRFLSQVESAEKTQCVTQLLNEFQNHGPNGTHICLGFEPMGPSVNQMVLVLPQFTPRTRVMTIRYPFWMAKRILKQALQALAIVHENGVAHGDFQPGNMLFGLEDLDSVPEETLRQPIDGESESTCSAVERVDGREGPWSPGYLCIAQPLARFTKYDEGFKIKLSDMGRAFFFTNSPAKILNPTGLRPPELIFSGTVHKSLDMWAFGCLVYELITGQPLFCVPFSEF